jgi:hypothetical protein
MMDARKDRREFMKESLLTPAAAAAALTFGAGAAWAQNAPAAAPAAGPSPSATPATSLPTGKIGGMNVSRMLLGGNLLTHFTHSRDLKYVYNLCANYNTDDKILETMALAEDNGINTLSIHTVPRALATMREHRRRGGKMQWIICPTAEIKPGLEEYRKQVRELVDDGCDSIYLWGVRTDPMAAEGKMDLLAECVECAKEMGVPSGVGAHDLEAIKKCEEHKVPTDFYIKTFHHHNYPSGPKRPEQLTQPYNEDPGYWCKSPQETIDVMAKVEKPWIAFKIMAAGAIPPKDAFQYVFDNGVDHALVGMFDFEIAEDAALMANVLKNVTRTRPWRS